MTAFDPMRFFALWMLTHEMADDLMKESVLRGEMETAEGMSGGPDSLTDGFMAMVAAEKERLRSQLASAEPLADDEATQAALDEIRFEVSEVRGRLDQMQTLLDAIASRLDARA